MLCFAFRASWHLVRLCSWEMPFQRSLANEASIYACRWNSNLPVYLSANLAMYLAIDPSIRPCVHLSVHPSIRPFSHRPSIRWPIDVRICAHPSTYLPIFLSFLRAGLPHGRFLPARMSGSDGQKAKFAVVFGEEGDSSFHVGASKADKCCMARLSSFFLGH